MIINCTPHEINVCGKKIPVSGILPRVGHVEILKVVIDEVPLYTRQLGVVEELPDEEIGTIFVVSAMVVAASKRTDLYSPTKLIRENGKVIGCGGLCR